MGKPRRGRRGSNNWIQQKRRTGRCALEWVGLVSSDHVHLAVGLVELDGAVAEREERPIAAGADALAGVVLGAALADDDAAGEDLLAAKNFDAQALGSAVATVAGGFLTCFMCHDGCSLSGDGLDLDDGEFL